MRFGVCVGSDQIDVIARAGFDFCELPARAVLPLEDDAAAAPALRAIEAAAIRPESFNSLVPPEIRMCGPDADLERLRVYLRRAFGRMAALGASVAVLGSGGARRIPDDFPHEQALNQLADALAVAGEESSRVGIALALEHLNRSECNIFTTVAESHAFVQNRGLLGVRLLADLHHLELEHEPHANVVVAAPLLAHVHVADGGRKAPGGGGYDYSGFMQALRAAGYDARISAECSWDNLEAQAEQSLAFMRREWGEAGVERVGVGR
jgi:sugar phosphate isomerase/epimerase